MTRSHPHPSGWKSLRDAEPLLECQLAESPASHIRCPQSSKLRSITVSQTGNTGLVFFPNEKSSRRIKGELRLRVGCGHDLHVLGKDRLKGLVSVYHGTKDQWL